MRQRREELGRERRQYIRLDSVFPVQFRLVTQDGRVFLSDLLQGFTNNVGKGGICLSVNNLNPEFARLIREQQAKLSLDIEMPLAGNPVNAQAKVAWMREVPGATNKYLIGLKYEKIDALQNNRLMRYAWTKKLFIPVVLSAILVLGSVIAIDNLINAKLTRDNKALVEQLVKAIQESNITKDKIEQISKEREDLEIKIRELQLNIKRVEQERLDTERSAGLEVEKQAEKMGELNKLIERLTKERGFLEEKLAALQRRESSITEEFLALDKRKANLEKANFDKMYQWLKVHQNPATGLVMSFEGDSNVSGWAFTYDQSLVAQAYAHFSDFERVRRILDFFNRKAKRQEGQFFNAYYVNDGNPAEYVVHSGPNIWLGIAIVQYTKKSKDTSYVRLAEEIASRIIDLQNKDKDGGIRGGPDVEWYSTEHNLDAYAFFNMLYEITGKARYQEAAERVLNWLVRYTYGKTELPVKRGKGDSTIATDTYAWSIAAIGPEKLEKLGMNPDKIMEFAEENCRAEVSFVRPKGQSVKIKGFDFASLRHVARGGIVSSEWTAQMVMAYKIMADFYNKKGMTTKAAAYSAKANEYLLNLSNMIISSPSPSGQGESCLPYATLDYVDTGHGWFTPKGKSTGSVAGTAYTLFAYYNYNPLALKD
jgi:hypothetical protein